MSYNPYKNTPIVWSIPVPVIYQGAFYEVDVIKSMSQVDETKLNKYIKEQIETLGGINDSKVREIIREELNKLPKGEVSKEELNELEQKLCYK